MNAGSRTPLHDSHFKMSFSGRSGVESPTPHGVFLLTRALRGTASVLPFVEHYAAMVAQA